MPVLVHDCPYCGAEHVGFEFLSSRPAPSLGQHVYNSMFACNACAKAVVALIRTKGANVEVILGNVNDSIHIHSIQIFPQRQAASCPEYCSPEISKAFLQAEENIMRGHAEAAASMDRRAIEIATKLIAPDLAAKKLNERINDLSTRHMITPALKDWAHGLRIFGNEALHDIEGVTIEEARQAHELTRFMLIYLFTLPEQVRLSKETNTTPPAS